MTTEDKFKAAVNVIRSLPKNGSYQPSTALMLRFYAYFKQATLGPCIGSRPPFYDLVGKAKYDAWKKLGDMSKMEAMSKYVAELHSIVETMSYSENVANFLEAPSNELEFVNMRDLELVVGDVMERVRSQSNSPLISREASPIRFPINANSQTVCAVDNEYSDEDSDIFADTIEFPDSRKNPNVIQDSGQLQNVSRTHVSRARSKPPTVTVEVAQELSAALQCLRRDLDAVKCNVQQLQQEYMSKVLTKTSNSPSSSIFHRHQFAVLIFLFSWPLIISFLMHRYVHSKQK